MRAASFVVGGLLLFSLHSGATTPELLVFSEPGFLVVEVDVPPGPYEEWKEPRVDFIMDGYPAFGAISLFQHGRGVGTLRLFSNGQMVGGEMRWGSANASAVVPPPGFFGWASGSYLVPGKQHVVLFTSGETDHWSFGVYPPDLPWRLVATGPTHWGSGRDAAGDKWVAAHASVAGAAYVAEGVHLDVEVEHNLLGFFLPYSGFPFGGVYDGATFRGPGIDDECPCMYDGAFFSALPGPGRYAFDWSGFGWTQQQVPVYAWADVPLD